MVFQYWDTSHGKSDAQKRRRKGDYSTCGTFRVEPAGYRLIHLFRARLQYHELKQMAVRLREAWGARAVIVEDASSGTSLIQDLRNETRLPVLPWKVGNREQAGAGEGDGADDPGRRLLVSVPPESAGPYIHEHLTFPNGKHDDMVDMTSMALAHLEIWTRRRQKSAVVREFRMVA
jgi:phage terminase large subunit-like protein